MLPSLLMGMGHYDTLGLNEGDVLVYSLFFSVLVWTAVLLLVFCGNRYASLSFGRIQRMRYRLLLPLLSSVVFFCIGAMSYWVHGQMVINAVDYADKLSVFRHHGWMTIFSLAMLYLTLQVVMMGAILRELTALTRRTWIPVLATAACLSAINLAEGGSIGLVMFVFGIFSASFEGILFVRTRSVWPAAIGCTVADVVLMLLFGNVVSLFVAAVATLFLPLSFFLVWRLTSFDPVKAS